MTIEYENMNKEKCPICSHEIMTPNYCDYCAIALEDEDDLIE